MLLIQGRGARAAAPGPESRTFLKRALAFRQPAGLTRPSSPFPSCCSFPVSYTHLTLPTICSV
eukprot:10827239-Alexandrium_andersonii.AAC.1